MGEGTQNAAFFKKSLRILTKENLSKSIKSAFSRMVYKFKRKVEIPPPATYELSLEFRSYDEDEEDTYSVVMSMDSLEKRIHTNNDGLETNKVSEATENSEDYKSLTDLINSLNKLLLQPP